MKKSFSIFDLRKEIKHQLWQVGMNVVIMVALGAGVGYGADVLLVTRPLGMIIGFFAGIAAAGLYIYRLVKKSF
jgi:F0F1-type ATP synthase assembly protein I